MSTMLELMAQGAAWDSLVAVYGESVTYTPSGGAPVAITAVWNGNDVLPGHMVDGEQLLKTGTLLASAEDIAAPSLSDMFTIGGAVYGVTGIGRTAPFVELQLERRTQVSLGGDPQRLKR